MAKNKNQYAYRFPRIRLHAFLLVVAVLGIGLGWMKMNTPPNREHLAALRFIELGASVRCENGAVGGITAIYLYKATELSDDDLEHLKDLPHLEKIQLDLTQVTDRGLSHLSKAPTLRTVHVHESDLSDVGIENLSKLPKLERVHVYGHRRAENARQMTKLQAALPNVRVP